MIFNSFLSLIEVDAINQVDKRDGIGAFILIAIETIGMFFLLKWIPLNDSYIYYQLVIHSLWIGAIILIVVLRKQGLSSLGFKKEAVPYITAGVFTILAVACAVWKGNNEIMGRWFFYLIVVGGGEEILFRGVAYPRVAKLFNSPLAALLITGSLFGAMHQIAPMVWNNAPWYGVFNHLGGGVIATMFFLLIYASTENIINAILVHAALDFSKYIPFFSILSILYVIVLVVFKKTRRKTLQS